MITINGRGGFYKKEVILALSKNDYIRVQDAESAAVPKGQSIMIKLNKAIISVFKVNPEDPPYILKRKIVGVSLVVISRYPDTYYYRSRDRGTHGQNS